MKRISKKGANAFYWCSYVSQCYELINNEIFEERIRFLIKMMGSDRNIENQNLDEIIDNLLYDNKKQNKMLETLLPDDQFTDNGKSGCFAEKR